MPMRGQNRSDDLTRVGPDPGGAGESFRQVSFRRVDDFRNGRDLLHFSDDGTDRGSQVNRYGSRISVGSR